jgi:hypothetical protein
VARCAQQGDRGFPCRQAPAAFNLSPHEGAYLVAPSASPIFSQVKPPMRLFLPLVTYEPGRVCRPAWVLCVRARNPRHWPTHHTCARCTLERRGCTPRFRLHGYTIRQCIGGQCVRTSTGWRSSSTIPSSHVTATDSLDVAATATSVFSSGGVMCERICSLGSRRHTHAAARTRRAHGTAPRGECFPRRWDGIGLVNGRPQTTASIPLLRPPSLAQIMI